MNRTECDLHAIRYLTMVSIYALTLSPIMDAKYIKNILVWTSLQTYHGICTFIAFLKRQPTHLAILGETLRYTPKNLNLLPTKFLFVLI